MEITLQHLRKYLNLKRHNLLASHIWLFKMRIHMVYCGTKPTIMGVPKVKLTSPGSGRHSILDVSPD